VPDLTVAGSVRSGPSVPAGGEVGGPTWCGVVAAWEVLVPVVRRPAALWVSLISVRQRGSAEVRLLRAKADGAAAADVAILLGAFMEPSTSSAPGA
jgi:hypothetical protein